MAATRGYTCDGPGCGQARTPSNHWLLAKVDLETVNHAEPDTIVGIAVRQWDDRLADEEGAMHLCGVNCMSKVVSATAENWK
jgi:hypothetical protein